MSLWMMQKMAGKPPTRELMEQVISMQANMGVDQLREALKQPQVAKAVGTDMQTAVDATDKIPSFIMDSMMAVYLKGAGFVFAVHEQGWPAVEKLYTEYPPQSTEHILHPEKWLAREAPTSLQMAAAREGSRAQGLGTARGRRARGIPVAHRLQGAGALRRKPNPRPQDGAVTVTPYSNGRIPTPRCCCCAPVGTAKRKPRNLPTLIGACWPSNMPTLRRRPGSCRRALTSSSSRVAMTPVSTS